MMYHVFPDMEPINPLGFALPLTLDITILMIIKSVAWFNDTKWPKLFILPHFQSAMIDLFMELIMKCSLIFMCRSLHMG